MKKECLWIISIFLILFPMVGFAHEGHGPVTDGIVHYVFSAHGLYLIPAAVVIGYLVYRKVIKPLLDA